MNVMSLDPQLLEILVCPQDKGPLTYIEDKEVLVNERLGVAYPIEDGIPVMLVDHAQAWPPHSAHES
ncbi:TPA: Trm112 family protein [Corynebacterium striatum]|nr:Trm112 family protein [Corynebacterium striatum]HAT1168571.1 Trm112 family protein [Corynebacterium striatum]HAT1173597.1 Trm112 family protein [Corynebacterium striatum]HAT1198871.1 Trm112 family protein [Corynebacterium striatum]HAT1201698.1 Trm112 family protein [Corynebacterium striatum]